MNEADVFDYATAKARRIMANSTNFTRRTDAMGAAHAIFMKYGYDDAEARILADGIVAILVEGPAQ